MGDTTANGKIEKKTTRRELLESHPDFPADVLYKVLEFTWTGQDFRPVQLTQRVQHQPMEFTQSYPLFTKDGTGSLTCPPESTGRTSDPLPVEKLSSVVPAR